jgi:hypothetical protein
MAATVALAPIEAAIAAVLQRWLAEPFRMPDRNCAIDLLDYAEQLTGRRFTRRPSRAEVMRIARDPYGVAEIAADALEQLGCKPIADDVARGDLAIIASADHRPTASLCLKAGDDHGAPMMAARGGEGIEIVRVEPEFAWRVPCPRP